MPTIRIKKPAVVKKEECVAAVFDLEGFTKFCARPNPQYRLAQFISRFVNWLSDEISAIQPAVHFQKFTGDGFLFLWRVQGMATGADRELISELNQIRSRYASAVHAKIRMKYAGLPRVFRCGIARGDAFSIQLGGKTDYVGHCINVASRVQKLAGLTFAVHRDGFNLASPISAFMRGAMTRLDGIGKEPVLVLKAEFDDLDSDDRSKYFT